MRVPFYLKTPAKVRSAVYAVVRHHGQRFKLSTGISVEVAYWDKSSQRARRVKAYPDGGLVNHQLDNFERAALDFIHHCILNHHTPTADEFRNAVHQSTTSAPASFVAFFESYYQKQNYSLQTLKNYRSTANWLRMYEDTFSEAYQLYPFYLE